MIGRTVAPVGLVLTLACGRSESAGSRPPSVDAHRTLPTESEPATVDRAQSRLKHGSSSRPRCVVDWPSTPPPPARAAEQCPVAPEPAPNLPTGSITFTDAPGQPTVNVEVARQSEHRSRGLMYRTRLGAQQGMLFSWPDERIRSFWMRNTCLPLDMLFVAQDGTIVGILEQIPPLSKESRSVPCPAAHVIEVNAGWSRQNGIEPGQKVQIDA